jgi:hypothetical protein
MIGEHILKKGVKSKRFFSFKEVEVLDFLEFNIRNNNTKISVHRKQSVIITDKLSSIENPIM